MNSFDDKLKQLAQNEDDKVPDIVINRIDQTLDNLPELKKVVKISVVIKRTLCAVASIAITFLFLLPNVSVTYAKSISKVPVIGKIVSVITLRNYTYHDSLHDMEINEPSVENIEPINNDINALTNKLVSKFYSDLNLESNGYGSIYMDYETITDNDRWFTLKLSINEIVASSNRYYKCYHIDKSNGNIIKLNDMFVNSDYKQIITDNINAQMQQQMQENENIVYWTKEDEFSDEFTCLEDDHNFYWKDNGNLVVLFNKYEVGPGSTGTPEFEIDKSLFENQLKPEFKNMF